MEWFYVDWDYAKHIKAYKIETRKFMDTNQQRHIFLLEDGILKIEDWIKSFNN